MRTRIWLFSLAGLLGVALQASAQSWNTDARAVGLGGIGGDDNVFASAVAEQRGERSIVLPLGLLQLVSDRDIFKPSSTQFDPLRALQYASNPLHFQFGRSGGRAGAAFTQDLRNATFNRDLTAYRGFVPVSQSSGGLVDPRWGHTFDVASNAGAQHGIYAGGGAHLAMTSRLNIDPRLVDVLSGVQQPTGASQNYFLNDRSSGQIALAATGGYRGRFSFGGSNTAFIVANVNYLHGLRYEDIALGLRLNTDSRGLVTNGVAGAPAPFTIQRNTASHGTGRSFDLGGGLVAGPWDIGFSGSNLGSRIRWSGVTQRDYSLPDLFGGGGRFTTTLPASIGDVVVDGLPDYRGSLAYRGSSLSFHAEVARHLDTSWYRGGVEHRGTRFEFRGALEYGTNLYQPSAGVSVAAGPRLWVDLAAFTSAANVERQNRYAVAASLRLVPRRASGIVSGTVKEP